MGPEEVRRRARKLDLYIFIHWWPLAAILCPRENIYVPARNVWWSLVHVAYLWHSVCVVCVSVDLLLS